MAQAPRDLNHIATLLGASNADGTTSLPVYVDSATNRLLVNTTGTGEEIGHAALGSLVSTVTTAGTAIQLASNACKRVIIQALSDNEDAVQIGISDVTATPETRQTGLRLFPTQSLVLIVANTNLIYVDAAVNEDGVAILYEN